MTNKEDKYGVTLFNDNDFRNRRFRLETMLEEHRVLYYTTERKPSKGIEENFNKYDCKAKSIRVQCVSDGQIYK